MPLINGFNKIDYKSKVLANLGATAIIFLGLVYFGIMAPAQNIAQMKKQVETEKADMEKNYLKGKSLRKISENLKTVEPQLSKLDEVFIKKDLALDFITAMEMTAENKGVEQKINLSGLNSTRSAGKNETGNETIPIQLSSNGGFFKQMEYLGALEALRYYINIKTLEISKSSYSNNSLIAENGVENGDSDSQVGMQILADTYWQN